jgi:hypothetical protein
MYSIIYCYLFIIVSKWLVSGQLNLTRERNGVRSQIYWYADRYQGFYDSGGHPAIYYNDTTSGVKDLYLKFYIFFKSEEKALSFESEVRQSAGGSRFGSPLTNLTIETTVAEIIGGEALTTRVYYGDYDASANVDSPGQTAHSESNQFSFVDYMSDKFKYQRIEATSVFSSHGNSLSCHLMSSAHCKAKDSYKKYDKDENNRIALSADMNGFFDGLYGLQLPIFLLTFVEVSDTVMLDGRYRVVLDVEAYDSESADLVFPRLKPDETVRTSNDKVMKTCVYVKNPKIFKKCLIWRETATRNIWNSMAVNSTY